jgi:hypothetical protein
VYAAGQEILGDSSGEDDDAEDIAEDEEVEEADGDGDGDGDAENADVDVMDDGEDAEEGELVAPDSDRRYGWVGAWSTQVVLEGWGSCGTWGTGRRW